MTHPMNNPPHNSNLCKHYKTTLQIKCNFSYYPIQSNQVHQTSRKRGILRYIALRCRVLVEPASLVYISTATYDKNINENSCYKSLHQYARPTATSMKLQNKSNI